jgi:predicted AlkP superfamily phosphohydrolase/phosphomutase
MVHYQTTDVVQHVMWGYMEEGHPLYRADICDMIRRRFLGYIDEQLKILDDAFRSSDGSCITFMVSDHGFQPHTHRFQLGNWLAQEGFMTLHRLPRRYSKIKDFLASTHIGGMNDFLGKTPLGRTHLWRKIQAAIREPVYEVDWSLTRAYSFSRGSDGFVFLLDKDSSRKAALEKELIRRFTDLRNPRTRVPIFQRISRKDEVYQGPRLESMPDLILKPAAGYSVTGDVNPFCDDLLVPIRKGRDFHIGMHHPDGILVAAGDPIKSNIQIAGIRLIDVAPTVLACLGLDVSATMDGRVIQDLFKRNFFRNRSDMGRSLEETSAPGSAVYSPQDIHSIEDRLRSLGYIE